MISFFKVFWFSAFKSSLMNCYHIFVFCRILQLKNRIIKNNHNESKVKLFLSISLRPVIPFHQFHTLFLLNSVVCFHPSIHSVEYLRAVIMNFKNIFIPIFMLIAVFSMFAIAQNDDRYYRDQNLNVIPSKAYCKPGYRWFRGKCVKVNINRSFWNIQWQKSFAMRKVW